MKRNRLFPVFIYVILFTSISFSQEKLPQYSVTNQIPIEEKITIESKVLKENKVINISLPEGYSTNQKKYPVIYMTDGSLLRLRLIRGVVSFLSSEDIKKIPDAILVGITHSNRIKELTPNDPKQIDFEGKAFDWPNCGGADQLLNFVKEEVIPVIESKYRTNLSRIFVGWSVGGLFGLYSMLKDPDLFNAQIAIEPSYWWKTGAYVDSLISKLKKNPSYKNVLFLSLLKIHIGPPFSQLNDFMEKRSGKEFVYNFWELPSEEDHQTSILPGLYKGLTKIFEEYYINNDLSLEEFKKKISQPILGAIYVSESKINDFGYYKLQSNKYDEAIEIFKYNVTLYPNSENVYDSLAEACMTAGKKELAIENYNKVLEINPQNSNAAKMLKQLSEK